MNHSSSSTDLTLRPFKLSDADDFLRYASDDQVTKFLYLDTMTTKDEALTFIKNVCIPHQWCRSICINDQSIGSVSVLFDGKHKADIGYGIATKYWGQGIATKAVKMAIKQVLIDFPKIVRVQAFIDVANKRSQKVLEKAGFKMEGLLRKYLLNKGIISDTFVYSLLSTDAM